MKLEVVWWVAGLAAMLVGGLLYFLGDDEAMIFWGELLFIIGFWLSIAGIAAAFINKNEKNLIIASGGGAVVSLITFICGFFGEWWVYFDLFPIIPLINVIVFVLIAVYAYMRSDMKKAADTKRMQQVASYMQQQQVPTVTCSNCGAIIPATSVFCPTCGVKFAPMESAPATGETCTNCGAPLIQGSTFCQNCGAPVAAKPAPAAAADTGSAQAEPATPVEVPEASVLQIHDDVQEKSDATVVINPDAEEAVPESAPAAPAAPAAAPEPEPETEPSPAAPAAPVAAPEPENAPDLFCPMCGTRNEDDNLFCINCGAKLK